MSVVHIQHEIQKGILTMKSITRLQLTIAAVALSAGVSLAQNDNESKPAQPKNHDETTAPAKASQRIGDPRFLTMPRSQ